MANNFTKAAFTLTVTGAEAALLDQAQGAARTLWNEEPAGAERREAYQALGAGFAAAFPPTDDDPFGSFLELFDDADYPAIDCTIHVGDPDEEGRVSVYFGGDQVSPDTLAELIRRTCSSALPCGFEYSFDCDRLRAGEFGGGYVVITSDRIDYHGSRQGLDRALTRAVGKDGPDRFVLVMRDREHGLSFWNHATGFGRLRDAAVFSEAEAASFDLPIAGDEPEWLELPVPVPVA